MKYHERNRSADTVFALVLLTLFTILAIFLVLIGGNAYRSTVARMERNNQLRTTVSYIANKIRASGKEAELKTVDGVPTLVLKEHSSDITYVTYIYDYNGSLCEFYGAETDPFSPDDGEALTRSAGVTFAERNGVLTIRAEQSEGNPVELSIRVRQNGE